MNPGWETSAPSEPSAKETKRSRHHGAVNFDELMDHYFAAFPRGRDRTNDAESAARRGNFLDMLDAFEKDEGRVRSQKWCPNVASGALLTAKRPKSNLRRSLSGDQVRYFAGGNPVRVEADLKIADLMAQADLEAQRVVDFLRNPMRGNALKQLYNVRRTALEGLEAIAERRLTGAAAAGVRSVTERQVARQLKAAVAYAERAMRLRALLLYLIGMASGAVGLIFVSAFMLFAFDRRAPELIAGTQFVPTALVLGGLGAVISVLQRMTRGQLTATVENGLIATFLLGMFRPIIGAVMAFAIIALILGGIIPLEVPEEAARGVFFLAGISFLAGFSERYAQDMLGAARAGATPLEDATTTTTTTTTETAGTAADQATSTTVTTDSTTTETTTTTADNRAVATDAVEAEAVDEAVDDAVDEAVDEATTVDTTVATSDTNGQNGSGTDSTAGGAQAVVVGRKKTKQQLAKEGEGGIG